MSKLARKQRADMRGKHAQSGLRHARIFKSRKSGSGNQADFLRIFLMRLEDYSFPIHTHGALAQIAVMATVVLGESVETRHVSKLLRE